MKRGETPEGIPYYVPYQPGELARAIKELGEHQIVAMINSELRRKGKARARSQRVRQGTTAKLLLKTG